MPLDYYILVGQTPVKAGLMEWAEWFENYDNRCVAEWTLGPLRVSTICMGLDHGFSREGPPVLFETMAFIGRGSLWQTRCCTWIEAEAQHRQAVAYTRTMPLRHPIELARGAAEAIQFWMREWDAKFLSRYGKHLTGSELV